MKRSITSASEYPVQGKRVLIVSLMILMAQILPGIAFSQSTPNDNIPSMPSPTVASLAKYADFPEVDKYGLAPFTIPIYNIKVKNFSLPITLAYHASGIRVSQESTWVGLGFDLESLGFITRSVRDLPDDLDVPRNLSEPSAPLQYHGWLTQPDIYKDFPNLPWAEGSDAETKSAHILSVNDGSTLSRQDCEPDVFYLKIGSINEKFIFDHDGNIVFLEPNSKLKITYILNDFTKGIREFTVVDDMGDTYYFGSTDELNKEVEETSVYSTYFGNLTPYSTWGSNTVHHHWQEGGTETRTFRTTWFIREIKVQDNNESIRFKYKPATEEFEVPLDQYYLKQDGSSDPQNPRPILHFLWSGLKAVKHYTKTKYLDEITTSNLIVDFVLSDRIDLKGSKKLDKISVNAFDNLVEECTFSYVNKESSGEGDSYNLNRLFLDKVSHLGKPPYVFYYSNIELPDKRSYKQDFWGFTCSKSTSLIPKIFVYPNRANHLRYSCFPITGDNSYELLDGSDRSVDINSVLAGSLQRVKLPTGGYHEIWLEPNDFYDENWGEIHGGGLRIREIRKLDEASNVLLKKEYLYEKNDVSSGVLINGLSFAVPTTYSIPSSSALMYYEKVNDPDVWDYFTLRKSNNYFPLINHDGALVAYTNVSIVESGNGKIEKEFYPEKNYLSNATQVNWAKPRTREFSFLEHNSNYYQDLLQNVSVNLKNYNLSEDNNWVNVPLFEHVNGSKWSVLGVTGTQIDYYFLYDGNYIKYIVPGSPSNGITIFNTEDADVHLGTIQKYGFNIFPFPQISDDGNMNSGKLKEIKYYSEYDFTNPVQQINYTYTTVGSPINVYGLVHATNNICNITLSPLPLEIDWTFQYSWNVQAFIESNLHMYVMPKSWAKYTIIANQAYLVKSQTTTKQGVTSTVEFSYNDNYLIQQQTENESDQSERITKYKYAKDYSYISSTNAINAMKDRNIVGKFIEKEVTREKDGQTKIVTAELNEYKLHNNLIELGAIATYKPNTTDASPMNSVIGNNGNFVRDNRYVTEITFDVHDDLQGNLLQYTDNKKVPTSFIWAYNNLLPVAEVKNANPQQIAYTSFETNLDMGNFTYPNILASYSSTDSKTGKRSYRLYSSGIQNTIARSVPAGEYTLSYWAKGDGAISVQGGNTTAVDQKWTYYETKVQLSVPSEISITGSGVSVFIDEVRLHPTHSQMTSYTYQPYIGITSVTDNNSVPKYFKYDGAGRLVSNRIDVQDKEKGVIAEHYIYHYVK